MRNQNEENQLREIPDFDTLHELLSRLNEVEQFNPVTRTENVTVEDIAEALNLDPEHVARELELILTKHREARYSAVLRELEEPLYRVERTGHTPPDPLGNPLYKLRSVQILAERNREKPIFPRRKIEETKSDKVSASVGSVMIILVAVLMVILAIKAIVTIAMTK